MLAARPSAKPIKEPHEAATWRELVQDATICKAALNYLQQSNMHEGKQICGSSTGIFAGWDPQLCRKGGAKALLLSQ